MEIETAHSPVRRSATQIDLVVKFAHLPAEVPFTASSDDPEAHGRLLYENAVNGMYGNIGAAS